MKVAVILALVAAMALASPVPDPEADPQLLLPHTGHPYHYNYPIINTIKTGHAPLLTHPYGLPISRLTYPILNTNTLGYPFSYPFGPYPYVVKAQEEEPATEE